MTPPSKLVYLIVATISVLAFMGMCSLCLGLFFHIYADNSVMVAVITLTSSLAGSLSTLLIGRNMQQHPPQEPTEPQPEVTGAERKP